MLFDFIIPAHSDFMPGIGEELIFDLQFVFRVSGRFLFIGSAEIPIFPERIFFTGDFNGGIGSTGYNYIINNGYKNAAQLAVSGDKHTHRTYENGDVLDYIFIKNVDLAIESYYVYDEKELSDHCPIYIDLSY